MAVVHRISAERSPGKEEFQQSSGEKGTVFIPAQSVPEPDGSIRFWDGMLAGCLFNGLAGVFIGLSFYSNFGSVFTLPVSAVFLGMAKRYVNVGAEVYDDSGVARYLRILSVILWVLFWLAAVVSVVTAFDLFGLW